MKKEEPTDITYIQYHKNIADYQLDAQGNKIPVQNPIVQKKFINKKAKTGYNWSQTENKKYLRFLMANRQIFSLPVEQKKKLKVNVMLSKKIPTRLSTQCHTHHQKMMLKFGSVENIITEMSKMYNIEPTKDEKSDSMVKVEEHADNMEFYSVKQEEDQKEVEEPSIMIKRQ